MSKLLTMLTDKKGHHNVKLTADDLDRLITWMDTYAHRLGSFSDEQEKQLITLKIRHADIFTGKNQRQATKTTSSTTELGP